MRWSVGDSDRFFSRAMPYLRWCFTPWFVGTSIGLFLAYAAILAARWSDFSNEVAATFGPAAIDAGSAAVLVITFLGLTLIHELAHGFACKYFGGEVHELGFMLLYFFPAFYCNVNDAWSFPDKKPRLWVTAVGTWAELLVTSLAAIVWSVVAPDTLISRVALAVILIGGFSAVVTNFNPLLPLDGYFALADYLEIPNLRQRSAAQLTWWLRRHVLRLEMPAPDAAPREQRLFLVFGALAAIYSGLLLGWIALAILGRAYRAVGLLGGLLVALGLLALGGRRLAAVWRGAMLAVRANQGGARWRRWRRAVPLAALILLGAAALVPWDLKVTGRFTVMPVRSQVVSAPDSGVVADLYPREGNDLEAGAPVARLLAVDRALAVVQRTRAADSLAAMLRQAQAMTLAGADARLAAEHRAAVAAAAGARARMGETMIRARMAGTVVTAHPERAIGRLVGAGDTLLVLHDLGALEARLELTAAGSGRVVPGQPVRLIGYQRVEAPFEGTVASVSPAATARSLGAVEVRIALPPAAPLLAGATGEASVVWRRSSLLGAVWWAVRSRLRNDLLL
jgi:biotin carboxyl carrier protein